MHLSRSSYAHHLPQDWGISNHCLTPRTWPLLSAASGDITAGSSFQFWSSECIVPWRQAGPRIGPTRLEGRVPNSPLLWAVLSQEGRQILCAEQSHAAPPGSSLMDVGWQIRIIISHK